MDENSSLEQSIHPIVGKLFALITLRLEDAHNPSVDGHRSTDHAAAMDILNKVETASEEIIILCEAIRALICTKGL